MRRQHHSSVFAGAHCRRQYLHPFQSRRNPPPSAFDSVGCIFASGGAPCEHAYGSYGSGVVAFGYPLNRHPRIAGAHHDYQQPDFGGRGMSFVAAVVVVDVESAR